MKAQFAEPGAVIGGKYEVERLLGQGGMGAVYVVRHTVTHKRLALKQLLPEASHGTHNDRFVREARAAGRIQHRYVVDIFDVGTDASGLYMVMELLEGKSLADMLQDETRTLQEVLLVLSRAMQGVAAAHANGVIHRDLKPDNIFVCAGPSGRLDDPRVLDFGISKSQADPNLTESGVMLGTPYYMSPEQIYARRDVDARVDVYAMGVILYEAIAGRRPFEAESVSALAVMIATAHAPPLRELRPDIPAALCDVVHKALSREREDRYESMEALVEAIEPFIPKVADYHVPADQALPLRTPRSGAEPTPLAMARTEASLPPQPRPARRAWGWVALVALVALAAGAFWLLGPAAAPVAAPALSEAEASATDSPVDGRRVESNDVVEPAASGELPPAAPEPLPLGVEPGAVELPAAPQVGAAPPVEVDDSTRPPREAARRRQAAGRRRSERKEDGSGAQAEARAEPEFDRPAEPELDGPAEPEAEPAPEPAEATGRAGTLGVDDF